MSKNKKPLSFLVSIIIPVYLRYDLLQKCLDAIPDAFEDILYEVILVDNGSPSEEKKQFYLNAVLPPHTRTIYLPQNVGFARACNKGFDVSNGVLPFFLNSDVIMSKGSGKKLVMDLDDPAVGVVGMKLLFPSTDDLADAEMKHSEIQRPANMIQHVGLFINLRGQVIHMYLGWSGDNPRVNKLREVVAVTGAALMTRRKLFREVGKFDPIFGAGTYEDVDFCLKVIDKELKVIVDVNAVGKHYTGATAEKFNIAFPLNENRMIFEQRWYNKLRWNEWEAW